MILDGNGRQTQFIDDRGDITLFAYDTMDREMQMTFHDGSTQSNVYDEADDVVPTPTKTVPYSKTRSTL